MAGYAHAAGATGGKALELDRPTPVGDAGKNAGEATRLAELFGNGTLLRLPQRLLRRGVRAPSVQRRPLAVALWRWAAAVALIGWLPLLLLVAAAPAHAGALPLPPLDFGPHLR